MLHTSIMVRNINRGSHGITAKKILINSSPHATHKGDKGEKEVTDLDRNGLCVPVEIWTEAVLETGLDRC